MTPATITLASTFAPGARESFMSQPIRHQMAACQRYLFAEIGADPAYALLSHETRWRLLEIALDLGRFSADVEVLELACGIGAEPDEPAPKRRPAWLRWLKPATPKESNMSDTNTPDPMLEHLRGRERELIEDIRDIEASRAAAYARLDEVRRLIELLGEPTTKKRGRPKGSGAEKPAAAPSERDLLPAPAGDGEPGL